MCKIWKVEANFSTHMALAVPAADGRPAISVTHHTRPGEATKFNLALWGGYRLRHPTPAATLELLREDFETDYFTWGGFPFVSERLRKIMALKPSTARFYKLDDSRSAPLPRSKGYRLMQPVAIEAVSDPDASEYTMFEPMPGMGQFPSSIRRMALRDDATPKHDLFYDSFFATTLLCTDAFAQRIRGSGCTGVQFESLDEVDEGDVSETAGDDEDKTVPSLLDTEVAGLVELLRQREAKR